MYLNESGNPIEGGTEERIERKMALWYIGRSYALWELAQEKEVFGVFTSGTLDISMSSRYSRRGSSSSVRKSSGSVVRGSGSSVKSEQREELGIYNAISHDVRMALECERISECKLVLNSTDAHLEEGALVRSKALCLLAYSLLRRGVLEGVSDAFEGCIDVAKPHADNRDFVKVTDMAKAGLADLGRYEMLSTRLKKENRSRHNIFLIDLCDVLKISPASDKWNMEMVQFLVYQRRWFAVANYCERMACKMLEVESVYEGDLKQYHDAIGNVRELTPEYFEKTEEKRDGAGDKIELPSYLRMVSDQAAADVALRLPESLLPIYLRSLRLEERLSAAQCANAALVEMGGWRKECADAEIAMLESIIKLKEEADDNFREGVFERAAGLYEQCLNMEKDGNPGGKLHAVLHSNRASCFSSLGRYEEAIVECSAALDIHSMYMKALLRRARCHAKLGDLTKSQEDYQRWNMLVEKARRQPYPAINIGPACFFDMPSEVKNHDWNAVKSEISEMGISISSQTNMKKASFVAMSFRKSPRGASRNKGFFSKQPGFKVLKDLLGCSCCFKKSVHDQVVGGTTPENVSRKPHVENDDTSSNSSSLNMQPRIPPPSLFKHTNEPRTSPDTAAPDPTTASHESNNRRPDPPSPKNIIRVKDSGFQKVLEPPTKIDANVDYYDILGCDPSASITEIKLAYHKMAKNFHPDRIGGSLEKFQEVHLAYEIVGDQDLRRKYDKMRLGGGLEP